MTEKRRMQSKWKTLNFNAEPRKHGKQWKRTVNQKKSPVIKAKYPSQYRVYQVSNVSPYQNSNCEINSLEFLEIPFIKNNMVIMTIKGKQLPVLIDSGATMSIASTDLLNMLNCKYASKVSASGLGKAIMANGKSIQILGKIVLDFTLQGYSFDLEFQILPEITYWAVLGLDFFKKYQCTLNFLNGTLCIQIPDTSPKVKKLVNLETNCFEMGACDLQISPDLDNDLDPPKEPHDLLYYNKMMPPEFGIENKTQLGRNPVPLDMSETILNPSQQQKLRQLVAKYRNVFAVTDDELGRTHLYEHRLRLKPGTHPPKERLYRTNAAERKFIKSQIEEMLQKDIIEHTTSRFSSPIVLVKKKDGSMRFCSDLRHINQILEEDTYPLPLIQDVLDSIGQSNSSIYSIIDLKSAFWQVPIHKDSRQFLTINSHLGKFSYKVLPFGLHSSPAAFQRLMNIVLKGINWENAIAFIDDVVVYSSSPQQHLFHLEEVFKRLHEAGLKLKPQKCVFGVSSIKYLGHVIDQNGVRPDDTKISAIKSFETPTSVTKLKSFLGLVNYYRKFVRGFAQIAKPLNRLTKKTIPFEWTKEAQESFIELKRRMTCAPVLAHADCSLPYTLTTDASRTAVGWVLEQKQGNHNRVICFGGKTLNQAQSAYGISDLEALACMTAIKDLDCYLRYAKFTIATDHQPLKFMFKNPKPPPGRWSKWIAILSQYDFDVEYIKGSSNKVADALSRVTHPEMVSELDDLDSYLCATTNDKTFKLQRGIIRNGTYVPNESVQDSLEPFQDSLEPFKDTSVCVNQNDLIPPHLCAVNKGNSVHIFHRTNKRVFHNAPSTTIAISREDPSAIPAEAIINLVTPDLKPIGPASKSVQLAAGRTHKKLIQQSLNKNGRLNLGHGRKIKGTSISSMWVYNLNLPHYKMNKKETPTLVYKYLTKALESLKEDKIDRIVIPPNDLTSLGYSETKALQLVSQVVWDFCHSQKPLVKDIFIPVQTQGMAGKLNNIFAKWHKNPKIRIFTPISLPTQKKFTAKYFRPDKHVTDPQQLIQDTSLSQDYSKLDFRLDPNEVGKLQSKDPYFKLIINYLRDGELPDDYKIAKKVRKDAPNFELIGDILYRFYVAPGTCKFENRARFQLCVPYSLRPRLLYAYHDCPISAHRNTVKMYAALKLAYYWKCMYADIQNWVQSCERCAKSMSLPKHRRAKLQPIMDCIPMSCICIDLIGPMNINKYQYRYVVTMIDRATRYCFARPIPDGQAVTIAKAIYSEVISRFGLIDTLVSDRGQDFVSPIVGHLCDLLGTKRIFTSAYHPMSNGSCENFNKIFKEHLARQTADKPEEWPEYVDSTLHALRTTVVKTLGYSPHQMVFGVEPKPLLDLKPVPSPPHTSQTVKQYLSQLRTQLDFVREQSKENLEYHKSKMTEYYDKRSKPYTYEVGDRVWIRSPQVNPGTTKKFRDKYIGPYILTTRTSENTFKVKREGGDVESDVALHSNRFKPCVTRYLKPPDNIGDIDETQVGPPLPLSLCQDSDLTDEDELDPIPNVSKPREPKGSSVSNKHSSVSLDQNVSNKLPRNVTNLDDELSKVAKALHQALNSKTNLNTRAKDIESPNSCCDNKENLTDTVDTDDYYEIQRIIRGKYTTDGPKYLVQWKGYSKKYNSWVTPDDMTSEALEDLKIKPVRMFGKKPEPVTEETPSVISPPCPSDVDNDPIANHTSPDPLYYKMSEQEILDAYEADTESENSDDEARDEDI